MIEIIGGGRNVCRNLKSLRLALDDAKRLKIENELLLAQKMNLESENARLKADMKEIANRDLQIAEEADKLNQKYEVECVKFKNLMLNVIKAREEIENRSTYDGIYIDRADVLEILDKLITESECQKDILSKYEAKVITRGKCMMCGKELTEGLFFCKECEAKAEREV